MHNERKLEKRFSGPGAEEEYPRSGVDEIYNWRREPAYAVEEYIEIVDTGERLATRRCRDM